MDCTYRYQEADSHWLYLLWPGVTRYLHYIFDILIELKRLRLSFQSIYSLLIHDLAASVSTGLATRVKLPPPSTPTR